MEKQENPFGICHKVFEFFTRLFSPRSRADETVPCQTVRDGSAESGMQVHFKEFEDEVLDSSAIILVESEQSNSVSAEAHQVIKRRRAPEPTNQSEENTTENGKISSVASDTEKPKVKYRPHLISVAPNINEKSESFITSRIEAMRKNLTSDSNDS